MKRVRTGQVVGVLAMLFFLTRENYPFAFVSGVVATWYYLRNKRMIKP